jgi:hypothetical protein
LLLQTQNVLQRDGDNIKLIQPELLRRNAEGDK